MERKSKKCIVKSDKNKLNQNYLKKNARKKRVLVFACLGVCVPEYVCACACVHGSVRVCVSVCICACVRVPDSLSVCERRKIGVFGSSV